MCGLLVPEVTGHNIGPGVRLLLGVAIKRCAQGEKHIDERNGHGAVHTPSSGKILCVDDSCRPVLAAVASSSWEHVMRSSLLPK